VEGPVRAHGHGCPERIDALGSASGEREDVFDFQGAFALAEADGLLDRELIEGVEGVLDAGGFDAGLGLVDSGFDLRTLLVSLHIYSYQWIILRGHGIESLFQLRP
jgi:hypothetical protein